jgi:hypothetical protein
MGTGTGGAAKAFDPSGAGSKEHGTWDTGPIEQA